MWFGFGLGRASRPAARLGRRSRRGTGCAAGARTGLRGPGGSLPCRSSALGAFARRPSLAPRDWCSMAAGIWPKISPRAAAHWPAYLVHQHWPGHNSPAHPLELPSRSHALYPAFCKRKLLTLFTTAPHKATSTQPLLPIFLTAACTVLVPFQLWDEPLHAVA